MSENAINSNISIEEIIAPNLNESNYASGLSDVFDNINDNFIKLANYDFIKGENGDSVIIKSVPLYENGKFTDIGEKLKNFIEDKDEALKTISYNNVTYDVWSTFKNSPGNLQMIYTVSNSENGISETPISSLYYVFLDGRFNHNNLKYINWENSQYNEIIDLSCIVVYSNGEFKSLDNAFPTVYYERGVGLCWKINGNNTGLPVQGIPGRDGKDTKLFIVQGNGTAVEANKLSININKIFDGKNGFTSKDNYDFSNLEINNDYSAVILTDIPGNSRKDFYFGSIRLEKEESEETPQLKGYADTNNTINTLIQNETLINLFKGINFKNRTGENLPGIFIPIETTDLSDINKNPDQLQSAHLIAATSITNNEGDSNINADMIWTPVNDINLEYNNSKSVSVDKYLYIKIDKNEIERVIKESWQKGNYEAYSPDDKFIDDAHLNNIIKQFNDTLAKTNYILKYKLIGTLRSDNVSTNNFLSSNSEIFSFFPDDEDENNSNTTETNNSTDFISENSAQCLYNYSDKTVLNLKPFKYDYEKDINLKPSNGNPVYITLNSLVDKLWPGYIPARFQPADAKPEDIRYVSYNDYAKDNISEAEFKAKRFDLKEDNQYITADRNYTNINLLPEYFIELIKQQKPIYRWKLDFAYNEFDNNLLKQNAILTETETIQEYSYNLNEDDKKILILFNTIFTDTITPSEITQFLWFNGFSKDLRKNYIQRFEGIWNENDKNDPKPYGVITIKEINKTITTAGFSPSKWPDGTSISTILLSGWNYDNTKLFKFIQFVPIFNNDFKIKDDTTLNINYNINISGDKDAYNNNKNITVNGALNSIEVNTNTLNALEIKNIYTNDNIVLGGDNSKLIIKPKNIYNENESSDTTTDNIYTELDSTNIYTNNILSKSLNINDVNSTSNKEFISTIKYNNGTSKDLNISLQGENAINIDLNLNQNTSTNPLNISINKNDQSTNDDLALKTNFNNIDITNNTADFTNFTTPKASVINYVKNDNKFNLAGNINILPNSALNKNSTYYRVVPDSLIDDGDSTDNSQTALKYRKYNRSGTTYLGINGLESILSEYNIPIFTKELASTDQTTGQTSYNYKVLSGLKYDDNNHKIEKDTNSVNNLNKKFKLKINKIFTFIAGVNAEREGYEWPYLDNGNVKIKLRYTLINKDNISGTTKLPKELQEILLFDVDESVTTKSFNIIGNSWFGKDVWGNDVDSIYDRDRLHQFHFKLNTLTTVKYNSILTRIAEEIESIRNNQEITEILKNLQDYNFSDILKNYKLNVKVISNITANWRHPKVGIYGAFLSLPIVVKKFNDSSFNFTGGDNIMFSSGFKSVVWENYTTVTAATAENGTISSTSPTGSPGWSMKFNTDYEYYLTPINSVSNKYEPNLNLCGSGLYISSNYNTNPEIVALGIDSDEKNIKLIRKYVDKNKNTTSEITIADLINFITAAASNTDAQVGL